MQAVRIQVEAAEMEVDSGSEAVAVAISTGPGFDLLDHGVEAFRSCGGSARDDGGNDAFQVRLDGARYPFDRLEPCFLAEQDYRRYLGDLKEVAEKQHCRIHAYVLITNHVHLLVTPEKDYGIGNMMQALGRRYVRYLNKTYCRTGTLWEGRYKASLIDSDAYLLVCMRYIELNPIRANLDVPHQ